MKFYLQALLFFLFYKAYSGPIPLKISSNEILKHFFAVNKRTNVLITSQNIYTLSKNRCKRIEFSYTGFSDAFYASDTLIILKHDTLFFLPAKQNFEKICNFISIKKLDTNLPSFSGLAIDSYGIIWVYSPFGGVYSLQRDENKFLSRLTAPVVNDLKVSADSCIYAATNVGLFRYNAKQNIWIKYAEEGIGGYEMPDNIIESILIDTKSNVWVIMPEHISFIGYGNRDEVHVPSFDYLGDKETKLMGINNFRSGYLMITTKGVLFLKTMKEGESQSEVHTSNAQTAFLLSGKDIETPLDFKNQLVKFAGKNGKTNYLFTDMGYWVIND